MAQTLSPPERVAVVTCTAPYAATVDGLIGRPSSSVPRTAGWFLQAGPQIVTMPDTADPGARGANIVSMSARSAAASLAIPQLGFPSHARRSQRRLSVAQTTATFSCPSMPPLAGRNWPGSAGPKRKRAPSSVCSSPPKPAITWNPSPTPPTRSFAWMESPPDGSSLTARQRDRHRRHHARTEVRRIGVGRGLLRRLLDEADARRVASDATSCKYSDAAVLGACGFVRRAETGCTWRWSEHRAQDAVN